MRPDEIPDIKELDLFRGMDEDSLASLLRAGYFQSFPPMVDLFHEGDPSDFLHVVVAGSAELYASWAGRESTMQIVRPVATMLIAASLKAAPLLLSARTLERSRLILIPSEDVRRVFDTDAAFARSVVGELAGCYRSLIRTQKDLKLRTSTERLANWILSQSAQRDGATRLVIDLEKRKLASLLGMTPENLSRAFASLAAQGVTVSGREVELRDPDALRAFAKPTPFIDQHGI